MSQENKPYNYFDKPDGEDILGKLKHVLEPTVLTALGISTIDVMCYSHPKGYLQTLGRYAYVGLPIIGVSTAFVCTTNIVGSLRKKDDKLNWFIGGFAAGSVFGIWRRSPMVGFNMGMALGILALVRKTGAQEGWSLFPNDEDIKTRHTNIWTAKGDWTLTAHRPGNWTRGE